MSSAGSTILRALVATGLLGSLLGCSAIAKEPQTVAGATERFRAAQSAREAACGRDSTPLPSQSLQPRVPEQETKACRLASFEYEKAALDLGLAQRRSGAGQTSDAVYQPAR